MSSLPKFFKNAVVALGVGEANPQWVGTGFIVGRRLKADASLSHLYLISNKHVLANKTHMLVCVNKADNSGVLNLPLRLMGNKNERLYSAHSTETVDVAAVELNAQVLVNTKSQLNWFDLDDHALTLEKMKVTGVDEGCLVYALGFPMGIVDPAIKAPFLRLGCISRIEDAFMGHGDSSFFVDAQTFPGNSGGPVVNRPETVAVANTNVNTSANLIGILNSYLPYEDYLLSSQTGDAIMKHRENSGLTKVYPVDRIIEVVDAEFHRCHG
jgi:S1-C subfamily serine protease